MSLDLITEFGNALQLCIKSNIVGVLESEIGHYTIQFDGIKKDDENLGKFYQIVGGQLDEKNAIYSFYLDDDDADLLISFLMLTRLKHDNILKLVEQDDRYSIYATQLGLLPPKARKKIMSLDQAKKAIFAAIQNKRMTLRELSYKSGLSQVTLSKFKQGNDIKLSNFFKIIDSLDLHLQLKV